MCSLNDVYENCKDLELTEKPILSENTKCRSCASKALVLLQKKDAYCKTCFLASETHKFRATLGKSKMMKPKDKVLMAYSGSQSSAALLHMLHCGVTEDQHKKLLFNVVVLFIDEGVLLNKNLQERLEIVEDVKQRVTPSGFPLFFTTLSESFNEFPIVDLSLKVNDQLDDKLVLLFDNVKTTSSKEDLLYLLRQMLLIRAARHLKCDKVFTAEVGTDLAVKLLTDFSLGRGDQASFETGFCDSRHHNVSILRPLRDFTKKEIVFYNKFNQVEAINLSSLSTKLPSNVSIKKLTEKFVTDLQEKIPSTIYTIFRTGEKLSINKLDNHNLDNSCLFCNDKIRNVNERNNYSAVAAANFSRNVSRKKANPCDVQEGGCCGSCSGEKKVDIAEPEIEKFLCYGCTLIARDLKNIECLPSNLIKSAVQRRNFDSMRKEISEFLIEPSTDL